MKSKKVTIPVGENETVSGVLAVPEGYEPDQGTGIIFAHGAANDLDNPVIVHFAEGLAEVGYLTLRFNFLYKEKGKDKPDKREVLYETWKKVFDFLREHPEYRPKTILAAGKSMGGRIASEMAAEGLLPVEKLIFLGYPLHPPGQKEKRRDSHLYTIKIPMLFLEGSKDPFCDLELLKNVLSRLKSSWDLEVIEGGDHSFNVPKSSGMEEKQVYERLLRKTVDWLKR